MIEFHEYVGSKSLFFYRKRGLVREMRYFVGTAQLPYLQTGSSSARRSVDHLEKGIHTLHASVIQSSNIIRKVHIF